MDFDDPTYRRRWLRERVTDARGRARIAGMPFTLSPEFASKLFDEQKGCCAVTGLKFNLQSFPTLVAHPFAPSIDRRLSSGGYTEDNVRLVCVAVNFGMGQWGEEVFLTLARAAVKHDRPESRMADLNTDAQWRAGYEERIAAAKDLLETLPEPERPTQRHRIAGLKSALTKGLKRLREAGYWPV
jgi:hypothetical protein